jgi:protein-disulfide isomerase
MKTRSAAILLAAALATPGFALAQSPGAKPGADPQNGRAPGPVFVVKSQADAHLEDVVRTYIEQHPDVVFNAVNRYVAETREKQSQAQSVDVVAAEGEMAQAEGLPVIGDPKAKVTMVYFLDAACGYCRSMTPALEDLVAKHPDLKIIHRYVAILTPVSEYAARVAGVVSTRYATRYRDFYKALMSKHDKLTTEVVDDAVAETLGKEAVEQVKTEATATPAGGPNRAGQTVQNNGALANRLHVQGTPFFDVLGIGPDGVVHGATSPDVLAHAVEKAGALKK